MSSPGQGVGWEEKEEKQSKQSRVSSYKGTNHQMRVEPITFLSPHLHIPPTGAEGFSVKNVGVGEDSDLLMGTY